MMPTYSVGFKFEDELYVSKTIEAVNLEDALKKAREIKTHTLFAKGLEWVDGQAVVNSVSQV